MSDLDIGMNDWMCRDLKWDDNYRPDRGKVLGDEEIEKLEKFHRYLDKDGDGILYRTLPGVNPKGALLHSRLRPLAVRHLHGRLDRVPDRAGSPAAQVGDGEAARARVRSSTPRRAASIGPRVDW